MPVSVQRILGLLRASGLQLLAVLIALALWVQVHGGIVSLSMDVPLQVEGLQPDMAIINNLPDHVRVTISGQQVRLNALRPGDVRVPLDVSHMTKPGVVELALDVSDIRLPAGLSVSKLQPDRLQVQLDKVVQRQVTVKARIDEPAGWKKAQVQVQPPKVLLEGPEVWLDALGEVETELVHPLPKAGPFRFDVHVESPSGQAIRVVEPQKKFVISGILVRDRSAGRTKSKGE